MTVDDLSDLGGEYVEKRRLFLQAQSVASVASVANVVTCRSSRQCEVMILGLRKELL